MNLISIKSINTVHCLSARILIICVNLYINKVETAKYWFLFMTRVPTSKITMQL